MNAHGATEYGSEAKNNLIIFQIGNRDFCAESATIFEQDAESATNRNPEKQKSGKAKITCRYTNLVNKNKLLTTCSDAF